MLLVVVQSPAVHPFSEFRLLRNSSGSCFCIFGVPRRNLVQIGHGHLVVLLNHEKFVVGNVLLLEWNRLEALELSGEKCQLLIAGEDVLSATPIGLKIQVLIDLDPDLWFRKDPSVGVV